MFLGTFWKESASQKFNTQAWSGPYYRDPSTEACSLKGVHPDEHGWVAVSAHEQAEFWPWLDQVPLFLLTGYVSLHCFPFWKLSFWLHSFLSSLNEVTFFDTPTEFPEVKSLPKIALHGAELLHLLKYTLLKVKVTP